VIENKAVRNWTAFFFTAIIWGMAIHKHNRTIWILAAVIFLLVLVFLLRDGRLQELITQKEQLTAVDTSGTVVNEEQFGDKVSEMMQESAQKFEGKKKLAQSLDKLGACFQMAGATQIEAPSLQIESLYQKFQDDLGSVAHQSDRWMEWHLRTPEGHERRLRLEITESDGGKVGRELHYFNMSRDGQSNPVELEPEKSGNPSDDVINQMLKEGEVFYKERAAMAFFPNGERVEYVEKNGDLSELEFFKENKQFRCHDVLVPETCQCL
jgi:hypothetical protein